MKLFHIREHRELLHLLDVLGAQVLLVILLVYSFIEHQLQEIHLSQEQLEKLLEYLIFQIQMFLEILRLKWVKEFSD